MTASCHVKLEPFATLLPLWHSSEFTDFWLAISGRVKPVSVIFNSLRSQCRFDTAFRSRCRFDLKWFDRCSHGCLTAFKCLTSVKSVTKLSLAGERLNNGRRVSCSHISKLALAHPQTNINCPPMVWPWPPHQAEKGRASLRIASSICM